MSDKKASRYAGEVSWETPERTGSARVICTIPWQNRLELELTWNNVTYLAWLDHAEGDVYCGVYELAKLRTLLRGKATCSVKRTANGVQLRGIFEEHLRDYVWNGTLVEMIGDASASAFAAAA